MSNELSTVPFQIICSRHTLSIWQTVGICHAGCYSGKVTQLENLFTTTHIAVLTDCALRWEPPPRNI